MYENSIEVAVTVLINEVRNETKNRIYKCLGKFPLFPVFTVRRVRDTLPGQDIYRWNGLHKVRLYVENLIKSLRGFTGNTFTAKLVRIILYGAKNWRIQRVSWWKFNKCSFTRLD